MSVSTKLLLRLVIIFQLFGYFPSPGARAEESITVAARTTKRKAKPQAEASGEIDLSALDAETTAPAPKTASPHHSANTVDPHFSIYFDLWMAYQPGKANFSFLNYHPLLFLEIVPTTDLQFSFEVNPSPRFFELDYQIAKAVTLRFGKIWIPFDDLNPHNMFGGMIGTSRMRLGNIGYLPDIWADLGIGAKFAFVDTGALSLDGHLYVVNGFNDLGTPDPLGQGSNYPNFNELPIAQTDKNNDKAVGGRLAALINRTVGVGFSFYTGRWTPESASDKRAHMLGLDTQLRLGRTEFRVGASKMIVGLPGSDAGYNRNGEYFEFAQKFGAKEEWRFLGRVGYLDPDERLTDDNDTMHVGGALRWKPGLIQWAIEHYQDIKKVDGKLGYSFTALRTIIQL